MKKEKGKRKTATKHPKKPWLSLVALSYIYPWEYAEAAEFIFRGWR